MEYGRSGKRHCICGQQNSGNLELSRLHVMTSLPLRVRVQVRPALDCQSINGIIVLLTCRKYAYSYSGTRLAPNTLMT